MTGAPQPREVLGIPRLPPAHATASLNRLRARLAGLTRSLAPPPVQILEALFGILDHRVLVVLCDAGLPDALTGPTTTGELADRLDVDGERLDRLLRFAATRGWLRIDRRGRVRPTRVTAFLRRDHAGGWRNWVDFAGGAEISGAVGALTLEPDEHDAFATANGSPFFDWMAAHPDRWATFDDAMAAGARMHALTLAAGLDWSQWRRVCDVGGGTGALLAGLLELIPHLEGTVFDLPGVVARAQSHPRLTAIGGDAFTAVPEGFDTYLLVNVIHDWADDDAGRILASMGRAAGPDARIVVVDSERRGRPRRDLAIDADVLMAALTGGGKERDAFALGALARPHGLGLERSVPLASGDVAHVFVRS